MNNLQKELEEFFQNWRDKTGTYLADCVFVNELAKSTANFINNQNKEMKEMEYSTERRVEVLYSGEYHNRKFAILNLGLHPTAYVELKWDEIEKSQSYDDYNLSCHGGFTFLDKAFWDETDSRIYIGWDYAHAGDYTGYYLKDDSFKDDKKWTTKEIFEHVKDVIEQFDKAEWVDKHHYVLEVEGE